MYDSSDFAGTTANSHSNNTATVGSEIDLNWLFDLPNLGQGQVPAKQANLFCCDTFMVPANGPLLEGDRNAVLCSVAKDMIYQYNIPPGDMDAIKLRLATGFSQSTTSGGGCRVDGQLLFEVLNEINAKYG